MAVSGRVRIRTGLAWLLTLGLLAYALTSKTPTTLEPTDSADTSDDDDDDAKLKITAIKPLELAPGAAILVEVDGLGPSDPANVDIAKSGAELLHRDGARLLVRVPRSAALGPAKVRVFSEKRRSKPWVITLRPLPRYEMLRGLLGGLALLVLGLRTVGQSLRAYAGRRVRAVIALLTRGLLRPVSLGALVGMLVQSTTSAAGLLAGLSGARMLTLRAAVTILLGAQLGAAVAAVALPLLASREALWIICVGVVWLLLSESRLSRALGMVVVGAGVILHGLSLLQTGLAPLVSDPNVLPYLAYFDSSQPLGLLRCVLAGAGLTALLQGPSPVFALVLSLIQSSGVLSLRDGLAILCGVSLGAVVGTLIAATPFGSDARRMTASHLLLGAAMTLLAIVGLPLWTSIAHLGPELEARATASLDALYPNIAIGLGAAFLACMASCTLLGVLITPLVLRAVERIRARVLSSAAPAPAARNEHTTLLAASLTHCQQALAGIREIILSADRGAAEGAEQALRKARATLRELLEDAARMPVQLRAATVASVQLTSAFETLLRVSEKAPEQGFMLSGEPLAAAERLHDLATLELTNLAQHVLRRTTLTLVQAQAHEIETNALDADARRRLLEARTYATDELPQLLWTSDLCAAYEGVGNQLYRIASALLSDELD